MEHRKLTRRDLVKELRKDAAELGLSIGEDLSVRDAVKRVLAGEFNTYPISADIKLNWEVLRGGGYGRVNGRGIFVTRYRNSSVNRKIVAYL